MQVAYHYDEITFEFRYTENVNQDQFADYNLPANATWNSSLAVLGNNEANVYDVALDTWVATDDYRTAIWYYKATGNIVVFTLGQTPNLTTMTNIPKPATNPQLFVWDEINDPVLDYTFTTDVALTGVAPLIQDGNDLTGDLAALVLLSNQTNPLQNGYYNYVDDTVNYALTKTDVWLYDLDATKLFQKKIVSTAAYNSFIDVLGAATLTIMDVVAFNFALIDSLRYEEAIPAFEYTFITNVVLTGVAPLIQDSQNLTGETSTIVKLTNQSIPGDNGFYTYTTALGNYTLTPYVMPLTHFYGGVSYQANNSVYDSHQNWGSASTGAAGYMGIFAEAKRTVIGDIDAALTGEAVLAIAWVDPS